MENLQTIKVKDLYSSGKTVKGLIAQVTDPNDFVGSGRYNGNVGIAPKFRELIGFEELPNGYGHPTTYLRYKTVDEKYNGLIGFGSRDYPTHIQIPLDAV